MLSIGIRSGQGFDRESIRKLIEVGKRPYEFDLLVLGSNGGGMVCATEAVRHGKKVALVYWRIPTPGEQEGYDEDRQQMAEALFMTKNIIIDRTYNKLEQEGKTELMSAAKIFSPVSSRSTPHDLQTESRPSKWSRKVRGSRLDLVNAITNMCNHYLEGLKYIHEVAVKNDIFKIQGKSGKVLSWRKTMDDVMDYIIQRNWTILTDFLKDRISLYDGLPVLMNEHTVLVLRNKGGERIITAETIISALEVHNSFPKDVAGAEEYGINLDDFFRMSTTPGKTLIVGAGSRGLECAGILASFGFPVVVVDRFSILKNCDPEIVALLVKDLTSRGVTFLEKKTLASIRKSKTGEHLVADFIPLDSSVQSLRKKHSEEFDTVLFTTKENLNLHNSGKIALQIEIEKLTGETYFPEEESMFANVVVIPDQRHKVALTQLIGKHVAEQLLDVEEYPLKLRSVPNIVMTPFEYAYVGISENSAVRRFGEECIKTFTGYFPTDDVLERDTLKDHICFGKIITMFEKDLLIGLHLLGRDAVQIMNKVMEPIKRKMLVSNLHPILRTLLKYSAFEENLDEVAFSETT